MMKHAIPVFSVSTLACFALVSCQSTEPLSGKVAEARPAPAPLPAWTTAKGNGGIADGRQVKFATKFIEISRLDGEERPAKRYRKTITGPALDGYLRSLAQRKGCDLMTAPLITTREGRSANVRVGRDLVYPESEGDSPKMKKEFVGVANYENTSILLSPAPHPPLPGPRLPPHRDDGKRRRQVVDVMRPA